MSEEIIERLTRVETKQDITNENLTNHLEHHFWINATLAGAIIAEAIAFIVVAFRG